MLGGEINDADGERGAPSSVPLEFAPTASWDILRERAQLLRRVRSFFDSQGFLEVETPVLSADIVVDRHLDPFSTILADDPRQPDRGKLLWLQTSPEFHMKRMMAAGAKAIFQVARVFRNGEIGRLHNPEFTMIEWYRRDDGLSDGMKFLSDVIEACCKLGSADQITYSQAFQDALSIDPLEATVDDFKNTADARDISYPDSMSLNDRDAWLDVLWTECVEPKLGRSLPTIVYNYPASQSALARLSESDPRVAERFELYIQGIELANGYHELLDPQVLMDRTQRANQARAVDGKPLLPESSRLLEAMQHGLPACTGVALGFDRLMMISTGAQRLAEVIAFPIERA